MENKRRKIAILGTGNVGATIAYTLAIQGICSEIVLIDVNKEKAMGEALDISQCASSVPSVRIYSGEYEDANDADVVIVTFGIGRKPGQTRLELAKINVEILESVMPGVAKIAPDALYIIVSNPVDILTYTTIKCTGLSPRQVIGTGTLLDSNRLTQEVSNYCGVDISNVNAYVLGEHGNSCMVPWSLCTIFSIPVKDYCRDFLKIPQEVVEKELKNIYDSMVQSGDKVIRAKGATYYAISASTVQLVKALFSDTKTILPLSVLLNGEYGAKDMCMGVACMVGGEGVVSTIEVPLTKEEEKIMKEKVASLDATYTALGIR